MISYFKYDDGNAFLLDGVPYSGYFHVIDGTAYTGKYATLDTLPLSGINNFLSDIYLNQMEFDRTFDHVDEPLSFAPNGFDIANKQFLDDSFNILHNNNLLVFKNLIIQNPNVFQISTANTHFYGLSSTDADVRNDDLPTGKNVYTHIDPFSFDVEWAFLDTITVGDFIVDDEDGFLYICSDGANQYVLQGSFVSHDPLVLVSTTPDTVYYIKQDDMDRKIFIVGLSSIKVYDSLYFRTCQALHLIDELEISTDEEYRKFVKIGKNVRTEYDGSQIIIKNKYSNDIYQYIDMTPYDIGEFISLDIRDTDDSILILSKKSDNTYFVTHFDIEDIESYIKTTEIFEFGLSALDVKFSNNDSNVFYMQTDSILQSRILSYPSYPTGQTKSSDFFYLKDYIYGSTGERFGKIQVKFNSNSLPSNSFNNILFRILNNNTNQYILTHNIGRIYVSKLPPDSNLLAAIPLDISKYFNGINCAESSFGLYFNIKLLNIVRDAVNLYSKAKYGFDFSESEATKSIITDLEFETTNLFLHGNESINVIALQRVYNLLYKIQSDLITSI